MGGGGGEEGAWEDFLGLEEEVEEKLIQLFLLPYWGGGKKGNTWKDFLDRKFLETPVSFGKVSEKKLPFKLIDLELYFCKLIFKKQMSLQDKCLNSASQDRCGSSQIVLRNDLLLNVRYSRPPLCVVQ